MTTAPATMASTARAVATLSSAALLIAPRRPPPRPRRRAQPLRDGCGPALHFAVFPAPAALALPARPARVEAWAGALSSLSPPMRPPKPAFWDRTARDPQNARAAAALPARCRLGPTPRAACPAARPSAAEEGSGRLRCAPPRRTACSGAAPATRAPSVTAATPRPADFDARTHLPHRAPALRKEERPATFFPHPATAREHANGSTLVLRPGSCAALEQVAWREGVV
eukprot:354901-Chlamydomonas_euryale.AAC.5